MLEYLQQYNNLPQSLRDALAAPGIITAIHNLETKYKISLALVVIKAAIGEFTPSNLAAGLVSDCKLSQADAELLARDLGQSIFFVLPNFKTAQDKSKVESQKSESSEVKATVVLASTGVLTVDERVTDLIKKAKIDLASQSLIDRLRQVLRTYLLGVRDRLAAMDALTKPIELGGLAFSKALAEDLIKIADGKTSSLASQSGRPSLPASLDGGHEAGYDLMGSLAARGVAKAPIDPLANQSRLVQQQQTNPNAVLKKTVLPNNLPWQATGGRTEAAAVQGVVKASPIVKLENKSKVESQKVESLVVEKVLLPAASKVVEKKIEVVKPALPEVTVIKPVSKPVAASVGLSEEVLKPAAVVKVAPEQYNKTESGAIKMDDVQFTPRVFTPIDELKYMTLKNFRNLNADPMAATEIVKNKLEALAKDDFSWRLEGISAWKQCPVNKMYVDIYHTAMSEGKQIGQVIEAKQKASPEALTSSEFEAIYSFNQEISLYK